MSQSWLSPFGKLAIFNKKKIKVGTEHSISLLAALRAFGGSLMCIPFSSVTTVSSGSEFSPTQSPYINVFLELPTLLHPCSLAAFLLSLLYSTARFPCSISSVLVLLSWAALWVLFCHTHSTKSKAELYICLICFGPVETGAAMGCWKERLHLSNGCHSLDSLSAH